MIAPETRFGHLLVIEEMSNAEAGKSDNGGSWCRVRCDCGSRSIKCSRHLRGGLVHTCGHSCRFYVGATTATGRKGWATRRARAEAGAA